ncbi:TolC family protein [Confluentibacter sediminis]|uniref:TolC family protein n=1 Tax=Confluentibacter sediminis TaxID=2219045 RepID=UPI000DAB6912|nr:TolC family protein [Confluentibacter sediminis]
MKIIQILILGVFLSIFKGYSQETYTLEKCLEIAFENNFDLKGVKLKAESSKVNLNQSWGNIMPNVNGNYNLGINNGRSIDPFTNGYINQQLTFSNAGLSAGLPIFNGFKLKNSIKQSYLNLKASEMEVEEAKQNLTVNITLAYLQVLNMRDLLELNKARLEVTQKQVDRLSSFYKEGEGNPADYTDMKGQLANDEIAVIGSKNNLKVGINSLFQLLGLESDFNASFEDIDPLRDFIMYPMNDVEIYNEALQNLATFKAKELRQDAAKSAVSVAKANFTPEISLFGQLNTNYSSAAQLFTETGSTIENTGNFVNIGGQQYDVMTNKTQYQASDISYNDQFDNNLSTSYGVSVYIPLFNGFRAKNNVKLRKIELEESQIELENTKFQYKQSIELGYSNMEAAFNKYEALQQQVESFEESFRVNEIRFNNGVSNVIEYIISKNNLDTARQNLSMAHYEYLLRTKVLDYYRGSF